MSRVIQMRTPLSCLRAACHELGELGGRLQGCAAGGLGVIRARCWARRKVSDCMWLWRPAGAAEADPTAPRREREREAKAFQQVSSTRRRARASASSGRAAGSSTPAASASSPPAAATSSAATAAAACAGRCCEDPAGVALVPLCAWRCCTSCSPAAPRPFARRPCQRCCRWRRCTSTAACTAW